MDAVVEAIMDDLLGCEMKMKTLQPDWEQMDLTVSQAISGFMYFDTYLKGEIG